MRTIIVSDLHLGPIGPFDAFAGKDELPAFLESVGKEPVHVFVNGDGVDFLMNQAPLQMTRERATEQAKAIVANPSTASALQAFGKVLKNGGQVTLRLGNHDLELMLPDVQQVLRTATGQPEEIANRLRFQLGERPEILTIGGARVLVSHGEHYDKWNMVEYDKLAHFETYKYTAGSRLVKELLNPLIGDYKLRFMNFLKPDFSGGALTGLAVNPGIVKELFKTGTLDIVQQLLARVAVASAFAGGDGEPDVGERLEDLDLTDEEKQELEALLSDESEIQAFGMAETVSKIQVKLARAGLQAYAGMQRSRARGEGSDIFFNLVPDKTEWDDAKRLAKVHTTSSEKVGAVVYGHTHAARWKAADGIVFANTGTWIWLMQLPSTDADFDTWAKFITELRENPTLDPAQQKIAKPFSRFNAVVLDPHPNGGATMSLIEWKNGKCETIESSHVPAASA